MITAMVTRIRQGTKRRLYLVEWREKVGVSAETLADRIGVTRQTIHRWEREQWRMDPRKQIAYAEALNIEPQDLWNLPSRPSLDGMMADASDEMQQQAAEMIAILMKTGTARR